MDKTLEDIYRLICDDPMNDEMSAKGYMPIYSASSKSKVVIVGQAPGRKAQETGVPWNDASGVVLRKWLGVTNEQFYDPDMFAILPMDFYYPGKGAHGDLPPRKGFGEKWHTQIFAQMPELQLIILVGSYAQKHYLGKRAGKSLTATVLAFDDYTPTYFPIVHPSPLTIRWRKVNPWFELGVVPELQTLVKSIINDKLVK